MPQVSGTLLSEDHRPTEPNKDSDIYRDKYWHRDYDCPKGDKKI